MEPGTIKRLVRYYLENLECKDEVLKDLKEFFGDDTPPFENGEIQFRSEAENSLFNEWFIYDF